MEFLSQIKLRRCIFVEKQKFYVNIQHQVISEVRYSDHDFIVHATTEEAQNLRSLLDSIYQAEIGTFWRSHVPFVPYHRDRSNEQYDRSLTDLFQMIYQLGDEQAKNYVLESGVLSDRPIDINLQ